MTEHRIDQWAIEEAKQNPGGWVYKIDGDYGPDEHVPPEAILGAWQVDDDGKSPASSCRIRITGPRGEFAI